MAKTKNRWITGTKRDSSSNIFTEYVGTPTDALNANVIPYDYTTSVYEAINNIVVGITGARGTTGPQGVTGPFYGPPGETGLQGQTGIQGHTGFQGRTGLQGQTGSQGQTGLQGHTGLGATGIQGHTGIMGNTGALGNTGAQGHTGFHGETGIQGQTGVGTQGATGLDGVTGLAGVTGTQGLISPSLMFNPISRYSADNTAGSEVWVVSSSTVYSELDWTRSGSTITLFRDSHGHAAGNRVIARNTNKDFQVALIDSTTLDSFSFSSTATDGTQGNSGAYSLGFTFLHTGFPRTGGTLFAPVGDHSDCQLLSMRIRTGTRSGTTYDLVVPQSAVNGTGGNTSLSDCYVPDFNIRTDNDLLTGIGATMTTNILGSYSTFRFGALGSPPDSRFILVHF